MAKTYGELILEYQNYDHSQEHYELMKECYELNLMEKYIQNQQFMAESMDDIREESKEFNESYFGESTTRENLEVLIESSKNKSKGIFNKIIKGLKSIWKKIRGFFSKLFGKSKKQNSKAKAALDKLRNIPTPVLLALLGIGGNAALKQVNLISPKGKTVQDELSFLWNQGSAQGFFIAKNQPFNKHLNIKGIKSSNLKNVLDLFSAACSDSVVILKALGEKEILSIEDIQDFYEVIIKSKFSYSALKTAEKNLESLVTTSNKKGITIQVSDDKLDKAIEMFKTIEDELEKSMQDLYSEMETYEDPFTGDERGTLNRLYTRLNIIIGNTMKAYNALYNYREAAIAVIGNIKTPSSINSEKDNNNETPKIDESDKDRE